MEISTTKSGGNIYIVQRSIKFMRMIDQEAFVEKGLLGILVVWIVAVLYLVNQAATAELNVLSWVSLTTFFSGFSSVVLIVIAILLARIKRDLR